MKLKQLNIPKDWTVNWNDFYDVEPDCNEDIDIIWMCFKEDISYFTKDNYFIDLGFYGGNYIDKRDGLFKVIVAKGSFTKGVLYENFITRNTEDVKDIIEKYMALISNNQISNFKGLIFEDAFKRNDYLFSSINKIEQKLTDADYEIFKKAN